MKCILIALLFVFCCRLALAAETSKDLINAQHELALVQLSQMTGLSPVERVKRRQQIDAAYEEALYQNDVAKRAAEMKALQTEIAAAKARDEQAQKEFKEVDDYLRGKAAAITKILNASKKVIELEKEQAELNATTTPGKEKRDTKKRLQNPDELSVEELKSIVELHRKDNEQLRQDYSYDIRKTDSLVSPYIGIVSYSFARPIKQWDYEVTFVYQDHQWVAKDWRFGGKRQQVWYDGKDFKKTAYYVGDDEITTMGPTDTHYRFWRGWNWAIAEYYRSQDTQ